MPPAPEVDSRPHGERRGNPRSSAHEPLRRLFVLTGFVPTLPGASTSPPPPLLVRGMEMRKFPGFSLVGPLPIALCRSSDPKGTHALVNSFKASPLLDLRAHAELHTFHMLEKASAYPPRCPCKGNLSRAPLGHKERFSVDSRRDPSFSFPSLTP